MIDKRAEQPANIIIDIASQTLLHFQYAAFKQYTISTAENGVGEQRHSGKTPRGWHIIRAKIGAKMPLGSVFSARRWTGEIYSSELAYRYPDKDWILSRILWLSGVEKGKNRLGECDTMRRYIYIHGSPEVKLLGIPCSKGCIRMCNEDIIELFDKVSVGTRVMIRE